MHRNGQSGAIFSACLWRCVVEQSFSEGSSLEENLLCLAISWGTGLRPGRRAKRLCGG